MYRSLFSKCVLTLFLLSPLLSAQTSFLPISADYAYFKNDSATAYVEFYISFYQGNLQYRQHQDSLYAQYRTRLLVLHKQDTVFQSAHLYKNLASDTSRLNLFNQFNDVFHALLPPGTYTARLQLEDLLAHRTGEYELTVFVPAFGRELAISGIQLAGSIQKSPQAQGLFYKNGMTVIPNAHNRFDVLHPMLYYYVELYNLDRFSSYHVSYYVTNLKGDTIKQGPPRQRAVKSGDQVEVGGFNAMGLPAGVYNLNIAVSGDAPRANTRISKRFAVVKLRRKPAASKGSSLPEMDEAFVGMSRDDLEKEFDQARYYASREEQKVFDELDNADAMRTFLTRFWQRQDKSRHQDAGNSRALFLRRLEEANARFSRSGQQGWKTDRGRVLILYGEPDEIERHPSTSGVKPYEIWKYNQIQGGVIFVFVDKNGFGRYYLIHSTHRKELQNPYWEKEVGIDGGGFYR